MDRKGMYAGSEWVEGFLSNVKPEVKMSELGLAVADFLGELYLGIYHLRESSLERVDWSNQHHIVITIGHKDWSTVDFNTLTRLVFLAHHMAIRVELVPVANGYMRVLFHQRNRDGDLYHRHPTLDEAVATFKEHVCLPEYNARPSEVENGYAGA